MDFLLNRQWYMPISLAQVNYAQIKYEILISWAIVKVLIDKTKLWIFDSKNPQIAYFICYTKDTLKVLESASKLIDDFLCPYVKALSLYIQHKVDLLRSPDGVCVPEGTRLVAINVEALYNSIPRDLGVQVVECFMSE